MATTRVTATRRDVLVFGTALAASKALGCAAMAGGGAWTSTRLQAALPGLKLDPGPPEALYWVRVLGADLPARTPGNQLWDDVGGHPDPFFVIRVGKNEAMRSKPQTDQARPTWPDGPWGNIEITPADTATIEVLESDAVKDVQMGKGSFGAPTAQQLRDGKIEVDLGHRGVARIAVAAAHALYGLGFDYEMRQDICYVKKVLKYSPAARARMKRGDYVMAISRKQVRKMTHTQVMSAFNSVPPEGLELVVQHEGGGATELIRVSEGPVYPVFAEYGSVA